MLNNSSRPNKYDIYEIFNTYTNTSGVIFKYTNFIRKNLFYFIRMILIYLFYCLFISTSYACVCGTVSLSGSTNQINGWAYDDFDRNKSLTIEIDMDVPHGINRPFATFVANSNNQTDLNNQSNHSFNWQVPSEYQYAIHIWFVYAISAQGNEFVLLQNAPLASPQVTLNEISPPESVYNYSIQACDYMDIADHPARAFRTNDGNVTLLSTYVNARRNIGSSLNNLRHDCDVIWKSPMIMSLEKFKYLQWPETPYTLDGQNIYMIFHNEWYGANIDTKCNGDLIDSWVSAMTMGVSLSKGRKFHLLNDYLLRTPATPWEMSFPCSPQHPTRYGSVGGSNIIHANGYYFKFFIYEPEPIPFVGQTLEMQCVMRTVDIENPSAWQVLTIYGWDNSKTAPCAAIPTLINVRSVAYDQYLKAYIAVQDFGDNGGFVFSVSNDLMNWSSPMPIGTLMFAKDGTCYPSILDPTDTTLNFERPGRFPYLYFSAPCKIPGNGVLRARLEFRVSGVW